MSTLSSLRSFRLLSSVRLAGLIVCVHVSFIQSISAQSREGGVTAASGQKTKTDDEPGLMTIEGTVVDESGAPVPKTRVRLLSFALKGSIPTSLADSEGKFRFTVDLATTRYLTFVADNLTNGKKAYVSIHEEGTLRLPTPLKLVLKPPTVALVEVRDLQGEPVSGAYLEASAQYTALNQGYTEPDGSLRLTVPADAKIDCLFALKSGVGLDYWVGLNQEGRAVEDLPEKLTLTLNGARPVRVQAIDSAGRPVAGVTIMPWTIQKPGKKIYANFSGGFMSRLVESVTDANGLATIDWIPVDFTDRITFLMQSKEFHLPDSPAVANDLNGEFELVMTLLRTTKISGTVLAEDGNPAAGILLQAEGRGRSNHYFRDLARTNAEGKFEFNAYPEQAYLVAVLDENWSTPSRVIPTISEGESVSDVELRLDKGTLLSGVVTGPDGTPRGNAIVTLIQKTQAPGDLPIGVSLVRWARTDLEGRYEFRIGAGEFEVIDGAQQQRFRLKIESQREVIQDITAK
jgi:hypothetical protein